MNRTNSLLVAAMLAAVILPNKAFAQAIRNTNMSRRLGSVIAGGWGNSIPANTNHGLYRQRPEQHD